MQVPRLNSQTKPKPITASQKLYDHCIKPAKI